MLVVGAGALGGLYAALLAHAGCSVSILGRPWMVEAVRRQGGLRVCGKLNLKVGIEGAYESPSRLEGEKFDLILLTVKAYQAASAALQAAPLAFPRETPILCLQNGIGVEEEVARVLPPAIPVVRGVSFCGAYVEEPGLVKCTGMGRTVLADGLEAVGRLADRLREIGLEAKLEKNIEAVVWVKTLVNAGINPFGALTGLRNGELLEVEGIPEAMAETVREGVRVAEGEGVNLPEDPVRLTFQTARATAQNYNSMLQDVKRGRRTEIDYINGALARIGSLLGVPTPLNSLLTKLVKNLEQGKLECGVLSTLQRAL